MATRWRYLVLALGTLFLLVVLTLGATVGYMAHRHGWDCITTLEIHATDVCSDRKYTDPSEF